MLKKKKVYFYENRVYTCRGLCCDTEPHVLDRPDPGLLYYDSSESLSDGMTIYYCGKLKWKVVTRWFSSIEILKSFYPDGEIKEEDILCGTLCTKEIPPLPKEFEVMLRKLRDGRYGVQINRNPESNGRCPMRLKPFFVSPNWQGPIEEGPALVRIEKEKGKYGYIIGQMIPAKMPEDLKKYATTIHKYKLRDNVIQNILEVDSPIHGHYMALENIYRYDNQHCYEERTIDSSGIEQDVELGYVVSRVSVFEYLAKHLFGVDSPKDLVDQLFSAQSEWYRSGQHDEKDTVASFPDFIHILMAENLIGDTDEERTINVDLLDIALGALTVVPHIINGVPLMEITPTQDSLHEDLGDALIRNFNPENFERVKNLIHKINIIGDNKLRKTSSV